MGEKEPISSETGLLILRQGSFIADCSGFFVRQAAENCRIAAMLPKPHEYDECEEAWLGRRYAEVSEQFKR